MTKATMRGAEDELDAAFEEAVEADRRTHTSFARIREVILATYGGEHARREVERARATEAEQASEEPPPLP